MNTTSRSRTLSLAFVGNLAATLEELSPIRQGQWIARHVVFDTEQALRLGRSCPMHLWLVTRHLPDACGFACVSLLKEWQPQAHYCVISEHFSAVDERRAFQLGRTTYLVPPVDPNWFEDYLLRIQEISKVMENALGQRSFRDLAKDTVAHSRSPPEPPA